MFTLSAFPNALTLAAVPFAIVVLLGLVGGVLTKLLKAMMFTGVFAIVIGGIDFSINSDPTRAVGLSVRFLGIVGSVSIFFVTTSPDELAYVMRWLKIPKDIVFAFVTAMRFVPVLLLDIGQIVDAQRSRGLELQKGNIIGRIGKLFPLVVPMIGLVLERSNHLAEAMESRAYGSTKQVSAFDELRLRARDGIFIALSTPLVIVSLYFILGA
ncbi:MAG: energy-coupling factor transporter transmembrane component T [Nitrososphaerales archaeon]